MSSTIPPASTSPAASGAGPQRELQTLLTSVGTAPLAGIGWLRITGSDRVRWLNGMVTNSIGDLSAGAGCYNFLLNAQGRIQGDGYVFAEPDHLLFETSLDQLPSITALLDRFIIMDDVELTDISSTLTGLTLVGPTSAETLTELHLLPPAAATPSLSHLLWNGAEVSVIEAYSPLVPRYEIWSNPSTITALSAELAARQVAPCAPAAFDLLRIREGTPLFGVDIRDRDLPQETGAVRALHFSKGCYLGQEIVERIRSRGNVHRTFTGFVLQGNIAAAGMPLQSDGKAVGELTSVAPPDPSTSNGPQQQIALGYIRREALALGKPLTYDHGAATPSTLPFPPATIL